MEKMGTGAKLKEYKKSDVTLVCWGVKSRHKEHQSRKGTHLKGQRQINKGKMGDELRPWINSDPFYYPWQIQQ